VRLARDQEDAQLLADALDVHHGLVVHLRQLAGQALDLELDHVGTAMLDPDLDRERRVGAHLLAGEDLAVAPDRQHRPAGAAALLHLRPDRLVLADDPEAWRLDELDLAVALVGTAGNQSVKGGLEAQSLDGGGDVVHHAVREQHHPGEPVRRHVSEAVGEGREQPRAIVARTIAGVDETRLDVGEGAEAPLELVAHPVGDRRPVPQGLGGGAVDDHRHDVLHLVAFLLDEGRIGDREQDEREGEGAHDRDRPPRGQGDDREDRRDRAERQERRSRKEGGKADGEQWIASPIVRAAREGPGREPDPTCSSRSGHTSRC
jgi:hypothetical protein